MSYRYDHRLLAEEMEIFFLDAEIGAGLPVWLPHGVAIRDALEEFMRRREARAGYQRVASPHVAKAALYARSGHLSAFDGGMFPPMRWPDGEGDYYLRPMNCPHHHKVFAARPRSYRQLPLRLAEYGQVYRYENSGSLRGLGRARGLCQNDAHIYVDPAEAAAELERVLALHEDCYRALGLEGYRYRLSLHDAARKDEFCGDSARWRVCEDILRQCLVRRKLPFFEAVGEAAFYGPKIDVQMRLGEREESIASVQLDFNAGAKFDLGFIDAAGVRREPWVIHRAPLGSHERFVALLLEYYDGRLPAWLAPVQLYLLPVGPEALAAAEALSAALIARGIRCHIDAGGGRLAARIRNAHRARPFAKLVLGEREVAAGAAVLELREERRSVALAELVDVLAGLVAPPEG